jgi:Holliday junction resolvase RusA-like endonuclease
MIRFCILGEPASKANSREIGVLKFRDKATGEAKTRPTVRKSDKALAYEESALRQVPPLARQRLEGPVRVTLRIWYASERPDLDESVVLDVLQDRWKRPKDGAERVLIQRGVYRNDRQVREKHIYHGIDAANPRTEVEVEPMVAQQLGLLPEEPAPLEPVCDSVQVGRSRRASTVASIFAAGPQPADLESPASF